MGVFEKASRNRATFYFILVNCKSNIFPIDMKKKKKKTSKDIKKLSQYNDVSGEKIKHIEADREGGNIPKSLKKM